MRGVSSIAAALAGLFVLVAGCGLERAGLVENESAGGSAPSSGPSGPNGTGGATAPSSSTGPAIENCLDGIDNDDNGAIDCADPACSPDHECVPEAPGVWQGFYRIHSAPYPNDAPAPCPDGSAPESFFDTPGGPASCAGCGCGPLTGATCGFTGVSCNFGVSCGGQPDFSSTPSSNMCIDFPAFIKQSGGAKSCWINPAGPTNSGGCTPSGGDPAVPPLWATQNDACEIPSHGGGCDAGQVCIPAAAPPYDASLCIARNADLDCPSGWTEQIAAYDGAVDTRDCAACACTPATACTGGSVTIYDGDGCTGSFGSMPNPTACYVAEGYLDNNQASFASSAGSPSGSCTATGGGEIGNIELGELTTFCCL